MSGSFTVTSPQIDDGGRLAEEQVFDRGGCRGQNISPALHWHAPPAGTRSFAVTVFDLDVPGGREWWHWVIFNIPADVTALASGAGDPAARRAPAGSIQLHNDFGSAGYGGPCPPPGDKPHRYELTVYALDTDRLPLDETARAATATSCLQQHLLQKAVLTARYGR